MKNTSSFYTRDTARNRQQYFASKSAVNDSTQIFIDTAIKSLDNASPQRILDLGTGNGYIAKTLNDLAAKNNIDVEIYAIDLSDVMLEQANEYCKGAKNIHIEKRDNNATGFEDNYFDVVVAKNVTAFSPEEIYRVLKVGGKMILKEYGKGKGLLEITELFPGRVSSNSVEATVEDFRKYPWKHIRYTQYFYTSKMSKEDVKDTLAIAPIIDSFSWATDEKAINDLFRDDNTITITSDPWILYAEK